MGMLAINFGVHPALLLHDLDRLFKVRRIGLKSLTAIIALKYDVAVITCCRHVIVLLVYR